MAFAHAQLLTRDPGFNLTAKLLDLAEQRYNIHRRILSGLWVLDISILPVRILFSYIEFTLNIQNRWEGEFYKPENTHQNLTRVEERIFSRLKDHINGAKLYAESLNQLFHLDAQWLSTILQNVAAKLPRDYGREPWAITTRAHAEWVRDNEIESDHLLVQLQQYFQPGPNTTHQQASQDIQLQGRNALGLIPAI